MIVQWAGTPSIADMNKKGWFVISEGSSSNLYTVGYKKDDWQK